MEKQIAAAFPEYSSREVKRVARESYRHLGRVAAETALLSRLDPARECSSTWKAPMGSSSSRSG